MRAIIVQGMAFGDEGKGATVDWLVRQHGAPLVVRYNGGPNAAHNVVTRGRLHHTFCQFGSGTLAGADSHLSKYALLDPLALGREAEELEEKIRHDPYETISVDPEAVVVTRYHVAANRAREVARGADRHGSVGAGLGEARADQLSGLYITAKEATLGGTQLEVKLHQIRERKALDMRDQLTASEDAQEEFQRIAGSSVAQVAEELAEAMRPVWLETFASAFRCRPGRVVVFEGAQGVLLDEHYGFAPYNSWTDCTFRNADKLLDECGCPDEDRRRLGVFRSYFTRHGPGPFPTESDEVSFPEHHNAAHPWMGPFRQGWFDGVMARYAVTAANPDALVVTHMDRRAGKCAEPTMGAGETVRDRCCAYSVPGDFTEWLEGCVGKPVEAISCGPTAEDRKSLTGQV